MNQALPVHWFDGVRPRAREALVRVDDGDLVIVGRGADAGLVRRVPLKQVRWPERQRHGVRLAHLPGGGTLSGDDGAAWDAWARANGLDESSVVKLQQSWRGVLLALFAINEVPDKQYQVVVEHPKGTRTTAFEPRTFQSFLWHHQLHSRPSPHPL